MNQIQVKTHTCRIPWNALGISVLIGLAAVGGFFVGTQERTGYHVQRYEFSVILWETIPVMDQVLLHGSAKHPAFFQLSLVTEGGNLFLEIYTLTDHLIFSQYEGATILYQQWFDHTTELSLWWGIKANGVCAMNCQVDCDMELWEWQELEPSITEWIMNDSSGS